MDNVLGQIGPLSGKICHPTRQSGIQGQFRLDQSTFCARPANLWPQKNFGVVLHEHCNRSGVRLTDVVVVKWRVVNP